MTQGRLIAVVGPSGAGKDSVMSGIHDAVTDMHLVRRVITRAPDLGGEDYVSVLPEDFAAMVEDGAFAIHWTAHGLSYGIPVAVKDQLAAGTDCLANLSRNALLEAQKVFPRLLVLNVTALPQTLERRLTLRGRETPEEIGRRLAQARAPLAAGLDVIHLSNDGALTDTIARAVALLQPERVQS